ncbi:Hypothetical protein NTJ_02638 [Nesidiocoris tenuis]|uniref:Secreted protein n=1 Tax=Nesidiocoris tenuis TaxID=355587 RepID=A0ABN7AC06_9HEMI|nr:Hypothetical protein NTJ_02638 [Nesidiocoris tenuis]
MMRRLLAIVSLTNCSWHHHHNHGDAQHPFIVPPTIQDLQQQHERILLVDVQELCALPSSLQFSVMDRRTPLSHSFSRVIFHLTLAPFRFGPFTLAHLALSQYDLSSNS